MSIMTRIVDRLNAASIPAYLPGRAPGECRQAHAVVTDGGRSREGRTTGRKTYYVTVYVPEQQPGYLPAMLDRVTDALLGMRDVRSTGDVSGDFIDKEKRAYCATVELYALCAI